MAKIAASTVKGSGFVMNRAANQPFYTIAKTAPLEGKQSPNIGFAYKNADTGEYAVVVGLKRNVVADFNAVKATVKELIAA
jgi:hypothetical protein